LAYTALKQLLSAF